MTTAAKAAKTEACIWDVPLLKWPVLDGPMEVREADDSTKGHVLQIDEVLARVASIREHITQVTHEHGVEKEEMLAEKDLELAQLRKLVAKKDRRIARLRKAGREGTTTSGMDVASTSADSDSHSEIASSKCNIAPVHSRQLSSSASTNGLDDSSSQTVVDDASSQTTISPIWAGERDDDASSQATLCFVPSNRVASMCSSPIPLSTLVSEIGPPRGRADGRSLSPCKSYAVPHHVKSQLLHSPRSMQGFARPEVRKMQAPRAVSPIPLERGNGMPEVRKMQSPRAVSPIPLRRTLVTSGRHCQSLLSFRPSSPRELSPSQPVSGFARGMTRSLPQSHVRQWSPDLKQRPPIAAMVAVPACGRTTARESASNFWPVVVQEPSSLRHVYLGSSQHPRWVDSGFVR